MRFKSLQTRLAVRLVLLLFSFSLLAGFIVNSDYFAVMALLFALVTIQSIELWRTITFSNRLLARFFSTIKYEDYSQRFKHDELGKSYQELTDSMNFVVAKLQHSKQQLERQSLYLKTILHHIETAIIVYDGTGEISLINRAANRLLQTNTLSNIRQLETNFGALSSLLIQNKSGQRHLCSCNINNLPHQLLVDMVEAKVEDDSVFIAAIQDIQSELEEKELKAWQDITRVLTHEISNSITPITSLANSCSQLLLDSNDRTGVKTVEDIDDLQEAISTIERRGENLVKFIANYRKLTKVPQLNAKRASVTQLLVHTVNLFKKECEQHSISIEMKFGDSEIFAVIDPVLVEQVLVNLIKNSIAAVKDSPSSKIVIDAKINKSRLKISVEDNGRGMLPEAQERIFVPFYSTKKSGSGIGLSLSRLIMQLHNGTIGVKSELGKGSCFTLLF
ncbi:sensor histidine kinase [Aliikangiella coralliicola]|uniref:histidine kinase n=1 Tax=Aliikangiella coralliicola TaxID=2592383 RepID=A0A545UIR1_9GAMM|nr:ATP-binding protein [Aliikangiella coralliicola]TQV89364.1 hypothetical protein FLL46_00330 [Aliikangiella coralliicola]